MKEGRRSEGGEGRRRGGEEEGRWRGGGGRGGGWRSGDQTLLPLSSWHCKGLGTQLTHNRFQCTCNGNLAMVGEAAVVIRELVDSLCRDGTDAQ